MSEFAGPGQSHAASYSPRVGSAAPYRASARTAAQQADDAVATAKRDIATVGFAIDAVRKAHAANDPKHWASAKQALDRRLAEAKHELVTARAGASAASDEARRQLNDAERALVQHETSANELAEPPVGWSAVSREAELVAVLEAPVDGARDGWARKEAALKAELDQMSPAECSVLARRLTAPRAGDPIASALAPNVRITKSRFDAVLAYLGGARKREAMRAGHAPRDAASLPDQATPATVTTDDTLRRILEAASRSKPGSTGCCRISTDPNAARWLPGSRAIARDPAMTWPRGSPDSTTPRASACSRRCAPARSRAPARRCSAVCCPQPQRRCMTARRVHRRRHPQPNSRGRCSSST